MNQADRSRQKTLLQSICQLQQQAHRERTQRHFVEGIRQVLQALDGGMTMEHLVLSPVLMHNPYLQKRIRMAARSGVPVTQLQPEEFRQVSTTPHASGVGAIVRQHWTPLERANPLAGLCWLAVGALRSPGNLGTILRTAHAAGAAGLVVMDRSLDVFRPEVVRASMGSVFALQLVRASPKQLASWCHQAGSTVVGTSPTGQGHYCQVPVASPLVVLVGEERGGLTAQQLAVTTHVVRIPMAAGADSLNVAVATGVVLFDLLRRRQGPLS